MTPILGSLPKGNEGGDISLELYMPNGIIISLYVKSTLYLDELMTIAWQKASQEPLFQALGPAKNHLFVGINHEADEEEFYPSFIQNDKYNNHEARRIADLPLLLSILRVVAIPESKLYEKTRGSREDEDFSTVMHNITELSPKELSGANMDNLEVKLARRRLLRRARRHLDLFFNPSNSSYPSMDDEEIRARYLTAAPKNMHINQALKNRIQSLTCLTVEACVLDEQGRPFVINVDVPREATVSETLTRILQRQSELVMPTGQRGHRPESSDGVIVGSSGVSSYTTGSSRQPTPIKLSGYLLKVCCSVAYLYDAEARLLDYEYIQACLSQYGCMPRLSPVLRRDVLASLKPSLHRLMQPRSLTPVSPRQQRSHNQFDIARCPHLVSEDHSSTTKLAHTASGDGDAVSLDWLEPEECIDDWIDHEDSDDEKDHEEKMSLKNAVYVWQVKEHFSLKVRSATLFTDSVRAAYSTLSEREDPSLTGLHPWAKVSHLAEPMLLAPTALDSHRPSPDGMSRSSSYSLHSSIIPIQDFGAVNSLVTTLSPSSKSYGLSTTSGSSNSLPTVIKSASSSTSLSTSFVSSPSFDGPLHQRNPSPNPRIVEKELNHSSGSTTNASSGRLFEPEDGQQHGQMMSLVSLTPLISAPGSFPMPSVKSSAQTHSQQSIDFLHRGISDEPIIQPSFADEPLDAWNIAESRSNLIGSIPAPQDSYIVRVGLSHGGGPPVEIRNTHPKSGHELKWNQMLNFGLQYRHLPRSTRLCVALVKMRLTGKPDKRNCRAEERLAGWANLNLFDARGLLVRGQHILRLWPGSMILPDVDDRYNHLNPPGTTQLNPSLEASIKIEFLDPVPSRRIRYPPFAFIRNLVFAPQSLEKPTESRRFPGVHPIARSTFEEATGRSSVSYSSSRSTLGQYSDLLSASEDLIDREDMDVRDSERLNDIRLGLELRGMVSDDPLLELGDEERRRFWAGRATIRRRVPSALPSLSQAVNWFSLQSRLTFYQQLARWPLILPTNTHATISSPTLSSPSPSDAICHETALQLLAGCAEGTSSIITSSSAVGSNSAQSSSTPPSGSGNRWLATDGRAVCAVGVADPWLRRLAVSCLIHLSDQELANYLLQLVQALKCEAYLDNPLAQFLLHRALISPTVIGLPFFWYLKSELHLPDARLRFGLLLEAFCYGCGPLLGLLEKQVAAITRLCYISVAVKSCSDEESQRSRFRKLLSHPETRSDLECISSPLCISYPFGELNVELCDVKRSKKRPLWLVWQNRDNLSVHHHQKYNLIFKHGDDLRQDMLILQILRVIDRIWKDEGLDLFLMPYGVLATGNNTGIIEPVRDAETVMTIQNNTLAGRYQIDPTQLHKWLQTKNPSSNAVTSSSLMSVSVPPSTLIGTSFASFNQSTGSASLSLPQSTMAEMTNCQLFGISPEPPPLSLFPDSYERAIQIFARSCAGYCVVTFVLGIRDRHPDNIMVDTTGRLFHIDFGHILNNRKKKFGFNRERAPFVLPEHFLYVLARGRKDDGLAFQLLLKWSKLAYSKLRKHASLILTLFSMMLNSGMPELTSVNDLKYLRDTLALGMGETKALEYFEAKFHEARKGAWFTQADWLCHGVNVT